MVYKDDSLTAAAWVFLGILLFGIIQFYFGIPY